MSHTAPNASNAPQNVFQDDLNLSIVGLGVEYPPFLLAPNDLDVLVKRWYPDTPA